MERIAHRCGPGRWPENSLDAAAEALAAGADRLEIDVRWTRDRVPVVSHDGNLLRVFGVDRAVAEADRRDLPQLVALETYLTSPLGPWLLDLKEGGAHLAVLLDQIEAWNARDRVVLGVRSLEALATVRAHPLRWQTLGFLPTLQDRDAFVAGGADRIRLWDAWFDPALVGELHRQNVGVWVMTGGHEPGCAVGEFDPLRVPAYAAAGVDGVLVNQVAEFLRAGG